MVWCQNRRSSRDDPRDFWDWQDMDDLQGPPSEPPGSRSEPTSDPLKSISLTSTAPWPPGLRPGEGQLVRPFEARQRTGRFPQGADTRAFRRRFFPEATPEEWND